jgi:hypothetical protein
MSRDELEDIITKCLATVSMTVARPALHEISRIAKGLPHYAHLLGLYAGLAAVSDGMTEVGPKHVSAAVDLSITNALQSIQKAYIRATESSQQTAQYHKVLVACAMADTNDLGYFSPADVREPLGRILKKPAKIEAFARHLHKFCDDESGPVLTKMTIRGRPQFRFVTALMQPFAILKGLSDKLITEDDLRATRDPNDPQKRLF